MALKNLPSQWTGQGTWNVLKEKLGLINPGGTFGPASGAAPVEPGKLLLYSFSVPSDGLWTFTYSGDTEPNAGYMVIIMTCPELGSTQMVTHAGAAGYRIPAAATLTGRTKKGNKLEVYAFMVAGGAGVVQTIYLSYAKISE